MSSAPRVGVQQGCKVPRGLPEAPGQMGIWIKKARRGGATREVQEPSWLCALPGVPNQPEPPPVDTEYWVEGRGKGGGG